jgi:hypothetical protein
MNAWIVIYLLFGMCFGAATFAHRHLFSEGLRRPDEPPCGPSLGSRMFWLMVCTWLWPIMALTGLNTALILARRRRASSAATPPSA